MIIEGIAEPERKDTRIAHYYSVNPLGFALGQVIGAILLDHS